MLTVAKRFIGDRYGGFRIKYGYDIGDDCQNFVVDACNQVFVLKFDVTAFLASFGLFNAKGGIKLCMTWKNRYSKSSKPSEGKSCREMLRSRPYSFANSSAK